VSLKAATGADGERGKCDDAQLDKFRNHESMLEASTGLAMKNTPPSIVALQSFCF